VLESFNLSQEDAEMLILQARVAAGWIDASELPQPEYVEEEAYEGEGELDGEGQEEAVAEADAEVASDDLDDQSRDM
jgi:N utilization substance protein A